MKKKIMIFYTSSLSGHFRAAEAIKNALLEIDGDVEVRVMNAFDHTNPILGRLIAKLYLQVIRKKPGFWGSIYDNPEILGNMSRTREIFHNYVRGKMKRLLDSFAPDAVICTQALPCGMTADYKQKFSKTVPLIGILTDHAPHSYWVLPEVDMYVVPSERTLAGLEKKGVPREKIKVLGIPVDSRFRKPCDKTSIRKMHALEEKVPTILIMGGSHGLGAVEKIVKAFLESGNITYQLLVVTGLNKKLYKNLSAMVPERGNKIKLFSYVKNIEELMEVSDLIITKAGGITTSEALAKKLPIVIADPIPGQERMNTDYLVGEGAALEISDTGRVKEMIDELYSNGTLKKMKESAARLAMPNSAIDIAKLVLKGF